MQPSIPSRLLSILLIEPYSGLAIRLQELLIAQFHTRLDLGIARSLREGMTHLSTHRVDLVLMDLTLPDYKGLDAIRALRMTTPATALVALSTAANEPLLLDAIGAGAHEALSVAAPSPQELRSVIERALVRAAQPGTGTASATVVPPPSSSPAPPRIVHELNNVMTSINGFADILLTRLPPDDPARTSAEQIRKAGTRATALVKAMAPPPESSSIAHGPDPTIAHAA